MRNFICLIATFFLATNLLFASTNNLNSGKSRSVQSNKPVLYEIKLNKIMMGTTVEIKALHTNIDSVKKGIYLAFMEMERIDRLLGYTGQKSDVAKLNAHAGKSPVKLHAETFRLLMRALATARKYQGVFDPTIGVVEELWGFNSNHEPLLPNKSKINALLPLVNYHRLQLHPSDTTAFLMKSGMKLDLGGIAKGYAIDCAVEILHQNGVQNFILKAGGDMYISGMKSKDEKWQIGIQDPRNPNKVLALLSLKDCAISTSGDYERCFFQDSLRYHHILNPKTGYPARQCQSVSIISEVSTEKTDALSTILFLLGPQKAKTMDEFKQVLMIDSLGIPHYDNNMIARYNLQLFAQESFKQDN